MTVPMVDWAPPDGLAAVITWVSPLGETRNKRPPGAPLPFRVVRRIDGDYDRLVDHGVYSIHHYADDEGEAYDEAMKTHRRMMLLAGQFVGQEKIVLPDGTEVQADNVICTEFPRDIEYMPNDNTIFDYVGTYRVDFRNISVT